jgi:hypothetical protein
MPKTSKVKLAYQAERQKSPQEVDNRVARNKARRHAIAAGKAKVGDGKEMGHKVALSNGGAATDANTKVQSAKKNRGWRKGESSYKVPNVK